MESIKKFSYLFLFLLCLSLLSKGQGLYYMRYDSVKVNGSMKLKDLYIDSLGKFKTRMGFYDSLAAIRTSLNARANLVHTHAKADITDFAHTHLKADITDFAHTHTKANITDFAHTHLKSDITDFAHTHVVADIPGLQTTLDGLQPASNAVVTDADQTITSLKTFSPATGDFARFGGSATFTLGVGGNPRLYTRASTLLIMDAALGVQIGKNTNANNALGWVNIFGNDATKAIATFNTSAGTNIATIDATGQPAFSVLATGASTDAPMVYNTTDKKLKQVAQLDQSQIAGLSTSLAAKQDASTAATITGTQTLTNKTISGSSNTLTNIAQSSITELTNDLTGRRSSIATAIEALGGTFYGETAGLSLIQGTASQALASGTSRLEPMVADKSGSVTGIRLSVAVSGAYTGNNFNGVALYTYSGGTLTQVAISANTATIWTAAVGYLDIPFTAPYSVTAGTLYFVYILYSSSAQTTAPSLRGASVTSATVGAYPLANSAKLFGGIASSTTPPSTIAISTLVVGSTRMWAQFY